MKIAFTEFVHEQYDTEHYSKWAQRLLWFSLVCDLCTVCHVLLAPFLGVISRLCSVVVALPGQLLSHFLWFQRKTRK